MKKGFTLIELLAVILILGIIALIAIPTVNTIIKSAKKGAAETSSVNYISAVEKTTAKLMMSDDNSLIGGTFDISSLDGKLDIKGTLPSSGTVVIDNDGVVTSATLCVNNFVINYNGEKAVVDTNASCSLATVTVENTREFLNGAVPVIGTGMIPVVIANDGTVTYADTDEIWYDYENKKWANAVILVDSPSKTYKKDDVILESDIQSYFVWIPRYRYKLWNTGTASKNKHSIEIVFEDKTVSASTGSVNGSYLTHPAFTSMDTNGFWIGKYEIGYLGATTTATAQVTSSDQTKIIVKPNVFSWRNNTVYNFFLASYNYKRSLDSHMLKNMEWGAVAYLSHSAYGINTEVLPNNNSSYKTGYVSLASVSQLTYPGASGDGATFNTLYNTENGYLGSTTGNITGVYDMSGGNWEYTTGHITGTYASSGFNGTNFATYNAKYFDTYAAGSTISSHANRKLGDATGELGGFVSTTLGTFTGGQMSSWYTDNAAFVEATYPFFVRGGLYSDGAITGQFSFARYNGGVYTIVGTRLVINAQ